MPRFSLKDLLASVTFIAVGLVMLMRLLSPVPLGAWAMVVPFSVPLIGAGICWPFSHWWAVAIFICLMTLLFFMPLAFGFVLQAF
jgi:hypothetical protein